MLAVIIIIFPIAVALSLHYRANKKITLTRKLLAEILFYAVCTNGAILIGLELTGMQSFNLFQMSVRFQLKWIVLAAFLSVFATYARKMILRLVNDRCRDTFCAVLPFALFFAVTYAVYTPSSLFLGNIEEFSLSYAHIVPIILCVALILMAGILAASFFMRKKRNIWLYESVIFSLAAAVYIQSNFLNPKLPALDGTEIDWLLYQRENWVSICFWVLCILLFPVCIGIWKEKAEKAMRYAAWFLTAVQLLTLPVLIFTNQLDESAHYAFIKDGEFSVGRDNNILLFVVDTLQADVMEEYLGSDAYQEAWLDDFTFFDNAVSGGAPTTVAFPVFLTGIEYDPQQPWEEYTEEIWEETTLYDDLRDQGYDIRFYTDNISIASCPQGIAVNHAYNGGVGLASRREFGRKLYQLVNFYVMPQCAKEYFWLSTDDFRDSIAHPYNSYRLDDIQFYQDMKNASKITVDYEKTFRLYHLNGVHKPFTMGENIENIVTNSVTEQQVLTGEMKIIDTYMDYLKAAGAYESSMVIIMGDHGTHEAGNIEDNPAVLIKLPGESHVLAHNSAPVHFRNVTAAIAASAMEDYAAYGPSVYDITEESDVERLHTIDGTVMARNTMEEDYDESRSFTRFAISGDINEKTYTVWDPYAINRIPYTIGEPVDFAADNEYAQGIQYRVYKENGAATASNELSICFDLGKEQKEDLVFHFTYSDVYNDSQKIRFYAGGHKVGDVLCTQGEAGEGHLVTIPKDFIQDGVLALRMVFPNAVTPNQLDRDNADMRILSIAFTSMWLS